MPIVLAMATLLSIAGLALLELGLSARKQAAQTTAEIYARTAADAGLTKALFEMNEKLKADNLNDSPLPQQANATLPNSDATFSYTITGDSESGYTVEAVGRSGNAERKVRCTFILQNASPFEYAIFTQGKIDLDNSAKVDLCEDSEDENLKVGTNSINPDYIILRNSATINGDVHVGPRGDPDEVIELKNSAFITGDTYALTQINELSSVSVPQWLKSMPSEGIIKNNRKITASAKYDGINLKNSNTITIDGQVTLYIVGDLILGNSCELRIADSSPDASLTLYLGGKLEGKNSSAINNLTKDSKRLKIYGLDSCENLDFKNSCDLYGAIYAVNADVVMHNSADIYGAIVSKSFILKNSATIYYDGSLKDASVNEGAAEFIITKWSEQ